jgi:murein DD-endopeptidase MepM/ murein hydrolase activator NlpD
LLKSLVIILLLINNKTADLSLPKNGSLIIGSNSVHKIVYTTSSNYGVNHDGGKALDSDYNSSWISGNNGPQWIEIDFGTKRIINKIVVYPGKKENFNTLRRIILQFYYSNSWFDFTDITLQPVKSGFSNLFSKSEIDKKIEINLGGIDARKFRIFIPADGTYDGYAAISEIEAYIGSNKLKYFDVRLMGMCIPIHNGLLPVSNHGYPGSARQYRGGEHAGLDILNYHDNETYQPIAISKDTPVLAAKDGLIIRADWDYVPMTVNEWRNQSDYYQKNPCTFVKRSFGGIQIWIDHEDGIVTTYNHLSKIGDNIKTGVRVKKGERIGWAGNSGTLGEAEGKNYGVHLHFEIWVDGYYLGEGMNIKDIKQYFSWIFSIH